MVVLRIEHPVSDFAMWKQAFDSDPVGREQAGVRRYEVLRGVEDPNFVMIDLEFDTPAEAERLLASMRSVWAGAAASIITDPRARIVETVDAKVF